jgi:PAS domain S-box-containing protein
VDARSEGQGRAGPRLGDFLEDRRDDVLEAWERRARTLPVAVGLTRPALRDHIPQILDRLVQVVRSVHTGEPADLGELPSLHAYERLDEGYDLRAAAAELAMLRSVVLEEWRRRVGAWADVDEMQRFGDAIDELIVRSVDRFARARERTLRALDEVSSAALGTGDVETFLPKLLDVLLETTAAPDAALILLRHSDNTLVVEATAGFGRELEPGTSFPGDQGLAARVANECKALLLRDASAELSDGIPALGELRMHAVYGVPLVKDGTVLGVALMGSRTSYDFSDDDKQLLRVLAERASSLIVQAQLAERVRRSEARLQAIVDHAPVGIYVKNHDGRCELINQRAAVALRRSPEEVLGKTDHELLPKEAADATRRNDLRVLSSGRPMEVEEIVPEQDGPHTYLSVKFALPEGKGRPSSLCGISVDITERKRAEALLRESEERFRLLVEGVEDYAIVMLDSEGRVASWNTGAAHITGYEEEEALGRCFGMLQAPEEVHTGAHTAALAEAVSSGRFEERGRRFRKDGSSFWADVVMRPLRGDTGRLRGFALVIHDVTARKAAEEELERAARLLDLGDAFFVLDEQWRIVKVNANQERLSRTPRQQSLGRVFWEIWPEAAAPEGKYWREYHRAMKERVPVHFEEHFAPLGLWTDVTAYPIEGDGIMVFFRDATARRSLEIERDEALARLEALLESAPMGIAFLDQDLRYVRVNTALARTNGLSASEHVGRTVREVLPPAVADVLERELRGEPSPGKKTLDLELTAAAPSSPLEVRHWLIKYFPVVTPGGRFLGTGGVLFDVTERKRRSEAEQQLIGIVSHDLKNPLSTVLLGAESVLRRANELDERTARTLVRIRSAATRALRLVRDVLDFTQARLGGGIPVHPRQTDLHALARQVVADVQIGAGDGQIELEQAGDGRGEWDPDRLTQIIENLVSNALKYGASGAPITVRTRGEPESVVLEVHNWGKPIPPEALPDLFAPMRRASEAAGVADRSVGLGLFIVDSIVRSHGGRVVASSSAEEGTTFSVVLPRQRQSGAANPAT